MIWLALLGNDRSTSVRTIRSVRSDAEWGHREFRSMF